MTQYLHAERGQFVAGTPPAAIARNRDRGWGEAAYRRTVAILQATLPHRVEGHEGYMPV